MRKSHSVSICLGCAAILVALGAGHSQEPLQDPPGVEIRDARILLADHRQLSSGQAGLVADVTVREGDRVEAGQLLAVLDDRVPRASLDVAAKEAENDVDIRFARAATRVAETEYRQAVEANKTEPDTFAAIEVERLKLEQDRSQLQIEVAEHQLAVAKLRKAEASALVDTHRLTAPIGGIITRVYKREGEAVQSGEPLFEIKRTDVVHIEAELPLEFLGLVRPNDTVVVRPSFVPRNTPRGAEPPRGKIFFIDVSADLVSKSVRFLAEVENPDGRLIAGLRADVTIEPGEPEPANPATVQVD